MAAFLMLPGLDGNFRIPETSADDIRDTLRKAMEDGTVVEIQTEMGDNPLDQPAVTVNGAALPWFSVIITQDPALRS